MGHPNSTADSDSEISQESHVSGVLALFQDVETSTRYRFIGLGTEKGIGFGILRLWIEQYLFHVTPLSDPIHSLILLH